MNSKQRARIAGAAAGAANGLFGGGGGMVFLPLMSRSQELSRRELFATCVGAIFPVCITSAVIYFLRAELSLAQALPYLAGGWIGGWIGGKLYGKISTVLLKWLFALFLFYAGLRYLL